MIFEWDDAKNENNISKHGIRFEDALYVFADPLALTREDYYEEENRWQIIGHVNGIAVVLAVYTINEEGKETIIRIISVRKATKQERRLYEKGKWIS
jgi:uncharacterized protein